MKRGERGREREKEGEEEGGRGRGRKGRDGTQGPIVNKLTVTVTSLFVDSLVCSLP